MQKYNACETRKTGGHTQGLVTIIQGEHQQQTCKEKTTNENLKVKIAC